MSDNELEGLETRYCFRCKGMAVLDKAHIVLLPDLLNRVQFLLTKAQFPEDQSEEVWNVRNSLLVYANILESMSVD